MLRCAHSQRAIEGNEMSSHSDVFIHVSPTGKDWNPGTNAMPVQTLGKALSLLPRGYYEKCHIILAPGTYTESAPINCYLPKPTGPDATDFAIVGAMSNVLTNADRICNVADTTSLIYTDTTLPPQTVDAFFGATLYCVSGVNKDASRTIVSNTANAFTINKPWPHAPAIGDVFQAQRPAVTIRHVGIAFWGPGPLVRLQHLNFTYTGANPLEGFVGLFLLKFVAESVEMNLNGGVFSLLHYCGINPGAELATVFPNSSFSPSREADWYIHDGTMSLTNRCQVPNSNNLVTKNLSIFCADSCTLAPNSIFGDHTDIALTTFSSFNHAGIAAHPSRLQNSNGANNYLIKADKNSIVGGGNAGIRRISLNNSGRDAILLQGNSHGYIGDVSGVNPPPPGLPPGAPPPGGVGVGIRCESMSTARVNQGGATTVMGGPDVSVGGVIRAYATLPFTAPDTCRIE